MENRKLFIGNLNFAATEEELKTLFSDYGTVVHIKMQRKKGCAFIEMSSEAEAALAIEKLNGAMFMDREVRVSLEMKAKEARALSIKKYNERAEGFSRRKKSEKQHLVSPDDTENDSMETGPGEPSSQLEDIPADEENIINAKAPRPAKKRPAAQRTVSWHPQRKGWRHDGQTRRERPSRDGRKSGHGRSPQPETNYNTRERWPDPDDRTARNYPRGKSGSQHPQRKEWSHDRPFRQDRAPRDGQRSGRGSSPQPETNYNTRERWPDSGERPARNYSRGESGYPHPQRKERSHDGPLRQDRAPRDGQRSGHGKPETNYNTRERWPDPDERPARIFSRGRSGAPHPQQKEWSHDKPSYSGRPSGPSRQPGAGTRNGLKPRPAGTSSNRAPVSSRPKPGPGGKKNPQKFARPKVRGGAENKGRGSRPKKDL